MAARPTKITPHEAFFATNTRLGSVSVPEARDDTQLTLLTAISVFGGSTYLFSKLKTFEKALLAAQKLYESSDYTIRSAPPNICRISSLH
jgi:hypothetical protein